MSNHFITDKSVMIGTMWTAARKQSKKRQRGLGARENLFSQAVKETLRLRANSDQASNHFAIYSMLCNT
jgi:hypothetical protein